MWNVDGDVYDMSSSVSDEDDDVAFVCARCEAGVKRGEGVQE